MDIADLKEILRILEDQEFTEFELEQDGTKLHMRRARATADGSAPQRPIAQGPGASAAATPATPPVAVVAEVPAEAGLVAVKSPIVGTFYRAPDPNAAVFVSVGDKVKVGQVLCIVEAMKLMNEIEAEVAGEIVKIHVENGQAVQYGDVLFSVRPS